MPLGMPNSRHLLTLGFGTEHAPSAAVSATAEKGEPYHLRCNWGKIATDSKVI